MVKLCKKTCGSSKICNPKTGRCVKKTGKIGRALLGTTTTTKTSTWKKPLKEFLRFVKHFHNIKKITRSTVHNADDMLKHWAQIASSLDHMVFEYRDVIGVFQITQMVTRQQKWIMLEFQDRQNQRASWVFGPSGIVFTGELHQNNTQRINAMIRRSKRVPIKTHTQNPFTSVSNTNVCDECPPFTICNPESGRCVKTTGPTGQKLMSMITGLKATAVKNVKKILNPSTGRWVKANGKIGKQIRKLRAAGKKTPKKPPTQKTQQKKKKKSTFGNELNKFFIL